MTKSSVSFFNSKGLPEYNQDRGMCLSLDLSTASGTRHYEILAVFDGNQDAGGIIASVACRHAVNHLIDFLMDAPDADELESLVVQSLHLANLAVCDLQRGLAEQEKSASTGTIALIYKDLLTICYSGDSGVLCREGKKLCRLTRDHTLAEALIDQGIATREQIAGQAVQSMLMSCLGVNRAMNSSTVTRRLKRPAIVIGGSDGALRALSDGEIADVLNETISKDGFTAKDVAEAIGRRAPTCSDDNVTVAVIKLPGDKQPASAPPKGNAAAGAAAVTAAREQSLRSQPKLPPQSCSVPDATEKTLFPKNQRSCGKGFSTSPRTE